MEEDATEDVELAALREELAVLRKAWHKRTSLLPDKAQLVDAVASSVAGFPAAIVGIIEDFWFEPYCSHGCDRSTDVLRCSSRRKDDSQCGGLSCRLCTPENERGTDYRICKFCLDYEALERSPVRERERALPAGAYG